MERYFKRKSTHELTESSSAPKKVNNSSKEATLGINLEDLPTDPGLRPRIWNYHPNVREQVRMAYIQKGPCQPRDYKFPKKTLAGNSERRFNPAWFDEFPTWLEYSIEKDAAFCLCCYLFKPDIGEQTGSDAFVRKGYSNWKKKEGLQGHVGGPNSSHNKARINYEALLNQNQARSDCQTLLGASIDCVKFLMRQGLLFCGHDEYETSNDQGSVVGLLRFLYDHSTDIKAAASRNSPETLKVTSCDIQKDIVSAISTEIVNTITRDISDSLFSVLINEFLDISSMNQMAIILRFVDKGTVIERYLGMVHVTNATALSLKVAVDDFFSSHGLIMSRLRGQTYVGTSNMHCEFNSLKTLIMKENKCAFYVHSFTHDLHSVLIDVAKNHKEIMGLFTAVANVVKVVGTFVQCRDTLRKKHGVLVLEALNTGEFLRGQGLNEESSNFMTLSSLRTVFSSVIDVLEMIAEVGSDSEQKYKAEILLDSLQSFNFIFCLHMMVMILGITDDLSQAFQRKDQDILNILNLVQICKKQLKMMRESCWDSLLDQVSSFCDKHHIEVHKMDGMFLTRGRPRHKAQVITNKHHYCVELFYSVIDLQLQELNNQFTEMNTQLLLCVACLDPSNSFSAFDKLKLIQLARYYPNDFSTTDFMILEDQLEKYILDMRSSIGFSTLKGISELAEKLVETGKYQVYPLVYLLLTLSLILPVATPRVERLFSAVNLLKNQLHNQMEDEWMRDSLIGYVEKDILDSIDKKVILQRLQHIKKFPWK
ncbi:uncharacterized protein LOC133733428 [Rosa rugosa]|uniref:uncharacterized protein LOC133733428 n=1 Tax=Rosa rugosa TaxID=74645 RepID=UPI002B4074A9|nr:uncharacterized protein LOC133733428 [Rosa rugosa]